MATNKIVLEIASQINDSGRHVRLEVVERWAWYWYICTPMDFVHILDAVRLDISLGRSIGMRKYGWKSAW